jgi:hypothetical protein
MFKRRRFPVDPSTIVRWVHRYAPELEKRVRWYQGYRVSSWRVDETYVKVGSKWKYLPRAVDKHGRLIDFMLSDRRNTLASNNEDGGRYNQGLRSDADDPPRPLPRVQAARQGRGASHKQAVRRLQYRRLIDLNVRSLITLTKDLAPQVIKGGRGRITNIGSWHGEAAALPGVAL